jgi:hypothetical protein
LFLTQQVALLVQPAGTPVVARLLFWSTVNTKPFKFPVAKPVAVTV